MPDEVARLVAFARALRDEGVSADPARVIEFCRAAALVGPEDLYWAGRLTLCSREEDIPVYDRVFRAEREPERPRSRGVTVVDEEVALASEQELLRTKSFADMTNEELAAVAAMMRQLRLFPPMRRTRRREPARAGAPDLRRTLRRTFRTGGEPVERAWRRRRRKPRRLVLLLDVSGSMADYSRALLLFAHAVIRADARWEAFCFGTRLTRLTSALAQSDADEALRRASAEVFDWSGGTRIGDAVWGVCATQLVRGAVVVICSDGLDVGDPEVLRDAMARLGRLAHRIIWLNPLKADPAYAPLARGMQMALPHVDTFLAGHNLESLEAIGGAF
ncbi:MAG TPA: VWA domain-containing protein [Gaiellaceae bacterium]|nr:VWA domain-containing protein [Gaiellaceae bacterium]